MGLIEPRRRRRRNRVAPDVAVAAAGAPSASATAAAAGAPSASATAAAAGAPLDTEDGASVRFVRLAADSHWLVCRSPLHGGKLLWMDGRTQQQTWRQPSPSLVPLPADWVDVDPSMHAHAFAVSPGASFCGAPADPADPRARTGICGVAPDQKSLRSTVTTLASEHALYPHSFLKTAGVRRYVLCEGLSYNGQRRRDVPDLASGTLYIDVGERAVRRKRHSFHHELWHMVDYRLLGSRFEGAHDAEWAAHNPDGFAYGKGGKHMRSDGTSSQLASAPCGAFLNRYSTSSVAEDKAEIWAALMCCD